MEDYRNYLLELIDEFVLETHSQRGQEILDDFSSWANKIWLVKPKATELQSLLDDLQRIAA